MNFSVCVTCTGLTAVSFVYSPETAIILSISHKLASNNRYKGCTCLCGVFFVCFVFPVYPQINLAVTKLWFFQLFIFRIFPFLIFPFSPLYPNEIKNISLPISSQHRLNKVQVGTLQLTAADRLK